MSVRSSGGPARLSLVLTTALATIFALVIPLAGIAGANHGTRTLQLTPETDDNPIATTHTVTATLSSAPDAGSPIEIDFEVAGPNDPGTPAGDSPTSPDLTCTITEPATSCTVSYAGPVVGT